MPQLDLDGFEEFDRKRSPTQLTPLITIQRRGTFSANRAAFEALGKPEGVKLFFNMRQKIIGIRPADAAERNVYAMRKQPTSESYLFSGIAFANTYGIPIGETRRYQAQLHGDMLVVNLHDDPISGPPIDGEELEQLGRQVTA